MMNEQVLATGCACDQVDPRPRFSEELILNTSEVLERLAFFRHPRSQDSSIQCLLASLKAIRTFFCVCSSSLTAITSNYL